MAWSVCLSTNNFSNQLLETIDLEFQLAALAICIWPVRITRLQPASVVQLTDTVLAADFGNGQSFGQITVGFPQQSQNLICSPSPFHRHLHELPQLETLIFAGPVFGQQVRSRFASVLPEPFSYF
jgi:hypothetical protein